MRGDASRRTHVFTVDVEEYFQVHAFQDYVHRDDWMHFPSRVERATLDIADLLDARGIRGTFFTLGWVAERHPDMVRELVGRGHEIASHGWSHRRLEELGPEGFRTELRDSKSLLEDISGRPVRGYRAPSYSLVRGTEWAFEILVEEGYRYDSSIFPIRRPGYGYPGGPIEPYTIETGAGDLLELPLATLRLAGLTLPAAGGAYFRHLPYRFIRWAFRRIEDRGLPGVFYIHSWEVDPAQPRLPVPWLTRLRHYAGLDRTRDRLSRLVEEFEFGSVAEAFDLDERSRGAPLRESGRRRADHAS